jgi:hypothetical protein
MYNKNPRTENPDMKADQPSAYHPQNQTEIICLPDLNSRLDGRNFFPQAKGVRSLQCGASFDCRR